MVDVEAYTLVFYLKSVLVFLTLYTIVHFWQKRYFYYYAWKIPGPFCLPIVGYVPFLWTKDLHRAALTLIGSYPSISRLWFGPYFFVALTKPEHVEIVLTKFLEKGHGYKLFMENVQNSLVAVPVNIWKEKRRIFHKSFNQNILNSYHDIFMKNSKNIVGVLDRLCDKEETDITTKLWDGAMMTVLETMGDFDPFVIKGLDVIRPSMKKLEEIMMTRIHKFWLSLDFFWKMSALHKDAVATQAIADNLTNRVIDFKKNTLKKENRGTNKVDFLNNLIYLNQDGSLSTEEIKEEMRLVLGASTETISSSLSYFFIILGIHLDIQEKLYQEVISVIGEKKEVTLEDINKLKYMERAIKETMRIFPALPLITRLIDRDLPLDCGVIPAGSECVIPILNIHRDPRLWPDPLKFDPDRFLPEEVKKRHRCAYLPFSFGSRDCVGHKFGLMYLQCTLSNIIRNFKIKTVNYNSVEEIESEFKIFAKPKGYILKIEKRNGVLL